jgi:sugar phosphate permease
MSETSLGPTKQQSLEAATMRRVIWRILPFLMVCYFIAYVDRVNAGFAALQMNKDLGLTAAMFGLGGGLFYIAYIIFEIPSNLALEKVGARLWIARIMISWGLVGIATAFITGPYTFYLGRFLLGAAEAGFFPGVILYLTYWFPTEYRGRIVATFMDAIPL